MAKEVTTNKFPELHRGEDRVVLAERKIRKEKIHRAS